MVLSAYSNSLLSKGEVKELVLAMVGYRSLLVDVG